MKPIQKDPNESDFYIQLAKQLAKPSGAEGIQIGLDMNTSNKSMIENTLVELNPESEQYILEIGPGNGKHVASMLLNKKHIHYVGLDISETMVQEAQKNLEQYSYISKALFRHYNGETIPCDNNFFDSIFTINTIYFWKKPKEFLDELARVLKPNGKLLLCFGLKEYLEKMPFTEYGFTLYNQTDLENLVAQSQFKIKHFKVLQDSITQRDGNTYTREYAIVELGIK
jgi:ubiquinone/menaquinone biosynthesis C-methylase UbiE